MPMEECSPALPDSRGPGGSDGFGSSGQMDPQPRIRIGSSLCIGSADDNPTNPRISADGRMDSAE